MKYVWWIREEDGTQLWRPLWAVFCSFLQKTQSTCFTGCFEGHRCPCSHLQPSVVLNPQSLIGRKDLGKKIQFYKLLTLWYVPYFISGMFWLRWELQVNNFPYVDKSRWILLKRLSAHDRMDSFYDHNFLWHFNVRFWSKTKPTNSSHRACLFTTEEGAHLIQLHSFMLTSLQPAAAAFWSFPSDECQLSTDICFLQGTVFLCPNWWKSEFLGVSSWWNTKCDSWPRLKM